MPVGKEERVTARTRASLVPTAAPDRCDPVAVEERLVVRASSGGVSQEPLQLTSRRDSQSSRDVERGLCDTVDTTQGIYATVRNGLQVCQSQLRQLPGRERALSVFKRSEAFEDAQQSRRKGQLVLTHLARDGFSAQPAT